MELKEAIAADPRVKALEELEKKLSQDEEVVSLSKAKDEAEREYNEVLRVFAAESVMIHIRSAVQAALYMNSFAVIHICGQYFSNIYELNRKGCFFLSAHEKKKNGGPLARRQLFSIILFLIVIEAFA